jgi:hypothetical protein
MLFYSSLAYLQSVDLELDPLTVVAHEADALRFVDSFGEVSLDEIVVDRFLVV